MTINYQLLVLGGLITRTTTNWQSINRLPFWQLANPGHRYNLYMTNGLTMLRHCNLFRFVLWLYWLISLNMVKITDLWSMWWSYWTTSNTELAASGLNSLPIANNQPNNHSRWPMGRWSTICYALGTGLEVWVCGRCEEVDECSSDGPWLKAITMLYVRRGACCYCYFVSACFSLSCFVRPFFSS